jgi:hypothetical protein
LGTYQITVFWMLKDLNMSTVSARLVPWRLIDDQKIRSSALEFWNRSAEMVLHYDQDVNKKNVVHLEYTSQAVSSEDQSVTICWQAHVFLLYRQTGDDTDSPGARGTYHQRLLLFRCNFITLNYVLAPKI